MLISLPNTHLSPLIFTIFSPAIHTTNSIPIGKAAMAMLTRLFLVWMAMVMLANALAMPPNTTSSCSRSLNKRTPLPYDYGVHTPNTMRTNQETRKPENTYTAQQMDQFQQGHMEALMLCQNVIDASICQTDRFNRIFGEYFPATDLELIIGLSPLLYHSVTND